MELVVKHISKRYKDIQALNKIDLVFTPGVWGLLGANGAGKSTLMEILIGNKITVADYLEYVAALKGISKLETKKRIRYVIKLLELRKYVHKYVDKLSGGTRQRVGVAQALLNDPPILVLDEPTSGLDPKERIRLRSIISKMGKEKIIILSTHIVSDIESIANQNIILKRGRLIDVGATEELLNTISGKVWEVTIPIEQTEDFEKNHTVINIRTMEQNAAVIRFITEEPDVSNARIQEPKLEDYYLWILKQN